MFRGEAVLRDGCTRHLVPEHAAHILTQYHLRDSCAVSVKNGICNSGKGKMMSLTWGEETRASDEVVRAWYEGRLEGGKVYIQCCTQTPNQHVDYTNILCLTDLLLGEELKWMLLCACIFECTRYHNQSQSTSSSTRKVGGQGSF